MEFVFSLVALCFIELHQKTQTSHIVLGRYDLVFFSTQCTLPDNRPVHLHSTNTHTLWLDVLLILSFAIAGLLLFVRCVQLILIHLNNRLHPGKHLFLICKLLLMTVCAYGVYVGRYLRFNSWDVFTHPLHLAEQMGRSILDPAQVRGTMAITISLSAFLFLIYELYENYQVHLSRSALDHQKT